MRLVLHRVVKFSKLISSIPAVRYHDSTARFIDVHTFVPLGDRIFTSVDTMSARISSKDVLALFPINAYDMVATMTGELELPEKAFMQYESLRMRNMQRSEGLWSSWKTKTTRR